LLALAVPRWAVSAARYINPSEQGWEWVETIKNHGWAEPVYRYSTILQDGRGKKAVPQLWNRAVERLQWINAGISKP
jgi:hypothetical protein